MSQCGAACLSTYPSVQRCATPLVLGIWQGILLQQVVDTVSVTSQNSQHQRGPGGDRRNNLCGLVWFALEIKPFRIAEYTNWSSAFQRKQLTGQICLQHWWDLLPPHNQSSCAGSLSDRWRLVWKTPREIIKTPVLCNLQMVTIKAGNGELYRYMGNLLYTCNMNRSPHEAVVIEETGGSLSQEYLHAAGVAFLCSQVEHRTPRGVLHVHIGCSLCQHAQRLPVALISLREQRRPVTTLHVVSMKRLTITGLNQNWLSEKHSQQDAEDWLEYCSLCLLVH